MPTRRPCIEPGCHALSLPGEARCRGHHRNRGAIKNRRRATLAPPSGAARHARATLNRTGHGTCNHCHQTKGAPHLQIDHITPLHLNGTDTTDNIQLLCLDCHQTKTTTETRARHRTNR